MKYRFLLLFFFALPGLAPAQTIDTIRQRFIEAFEQDDRASAALWLDSLERLENDAQVALLQDERWLAFYWLGWYGNLFDEAASFDVEEHAWQNQKLPPPDDSLFGLLDRALFADRFVLYEEIRRAFLTEEERAFAVLMLDYLLRVESTDDAWVQRADVFLQRFSTSRFANYLRSIRPDVVTTGKSAFTLNFLVFNGTWRGELERTLRPAWGVEAGLGWWYRRVTVGAQFAFGGQRLDRDLEHLGYIWPEGDRSNLICGELELGFDLIDRSRLRLFPSVGGGFSYLSPPTPDEEEEPNPDYYDNFSFFTGHLLAAVTADVRWPIKEETSEGIYRGSSHGIRLRAGYRRLNWDRKNEQLGGHMFFIAIGYQLFVRNKAYK
jgi:hypothetical protein